MRPGEPRISAILAPTLAQSREHVRNISEWFRRNRRLRQLVRTETADELELATGSSIRAYPCSARSIRGGSWSSVLLDEVGHWLSSPDGNQTATHVWEAAAPSLATFAEEGWALAISTPLWRDSWFGRLCQRGETGESARLHYLHQPTSAHMNPMISEAWLEERRREDPDLYRREFEARFLDGASSYLSSSSVLSAVRQGEGILPPEPGLSYAAAIDPAFENDRFALAIGHRDRATDGTVWLVADGVWTWLRKGFEMTLSEVARIAQTYRIDRLRSDQYAPRPIVEGLGRYGLEVDLRPWTVTTRASAFSRLKAALQIGNLELPDDAALVSELLALEAVPLPSGGTRIAAARGHDDRCFAVAAVLDDLTRPTARSVSNVGVLTAGISYPWEGSR